MGEDRRCRRRAENRHKGVGIANRHQAKMTFSHEDDQSQNDHTMHDAV